MGARLTRNQTRICSVMKITQHHLSSLFDERYIERGNQYFEAGMVELVSIKHDEIKARCMGTRRYKVELWFDGTRLSGKCSCPAFAEFGPCKHMAAAALAAQKGGKSYAPSPIYQAQTAELNAVERRLNRMRKAELIELIWHLANDEDNILYFLDGDDAKRI